MSRCCCFVLWPSRIFTLIGEDAFSVSLITLSERELLKSILEEASLIPQNDIKEYFQLCRIVQY